MTLRTLSAFLLMHALCSCGDDSIAPDGGFDGGGFDGAAFDGMDSTPPHSTGTVHLVMRV